MALVVLLRGVNVGGHRTFRPAALVKQLRGLDAVNIGAAGTFVVRGPIRQTQLREEIARRLPFDTEIMICKGRDLLSLQARDLFAAHPQQPDVVRFVSLLARRPRAAPSLPIVLPAQGEWSLQALGCEGRFVFGVYRRHMKAAASLGKLDRLFGSPATTRSWNTITAICRAITD